MRGWIQIPIVLLSIVTGAGCVSSSKMLSEDLKHDGFSIALYSGGACGNTAKIAATDATSVTRFSEWYRSRPSTTPGSDSLLNFSFERDVLGASTPSVVLKIQTTHFQVSFFRLTSKVLLESRANPTADWSVVGSWKSRTEDGEFMKWAESQIVADLVNKTIDQKHAEDTSQ